MLGISFTTFKIESQLELKTNIGKELPHYGDNNMKPLIIDLKIFIIAKKQNKLKLSSSFLMHVIFSILAGFLVATHITAPFPSSQITILSSVHTIQKRLILQL
jgi:hypothetical protein